jgi:hypothetical protein
VVVQRNIKSSLLLLLVISAAFAFSILYSSRGLTVGTTTSTGEALTQSPLHVALDISRRVPGDVEDQSAPGDNNVSPEQSTHAEISLPSANSSAAPAAAAPNTVHDQKAGPSKRRCCEATLASTCNTCLKFSIWQNYLTLVIYTKPSVS